MTTNPFRPDPMLADVSTGDLKTASQGCTEMTCLYHGRIVAELRRRAESRKR